MPRKRKPKKPEKPTLEFDLLFDDLTMNEAEGGEYARVKEIIESEFPYPDEWCIKTRLTIQGMMGVCDFVLNLYQDGRVYIIQYMPSIGDVYLNTDISALARWCEIAGWKIPEPTPLLVQDGLAFWKHWWKTTLINSTYLDERYGKRQNLAMQGRDDDDDEL